MAVLEEMSIRQSSSGKAKPGEEETESGDEEDSEDFIERRNNYVKRCIKNHLARGKAEGLMTGSKNPVAAEQRRATVKDFLRDIVGAKKCASCSGSVDLIY